MSNYLSRISKSADVKDSEQNQFRAQEAEQQISADILATEKEISITKRNIENAKNAVPLDTEVFLKQTVKLEGLEKGVKLLKELKEELFSEETEKEVGKTKG